MSDYKARKESGKFKYILCYSLTKYISNNLVNYRKFKYILCYSLTCFFCHLYASFAKFKYILCYSLTLVLQKTNKTKIHLNTSYVIV